MSFLSDLEIQTLLRKYRVRQSRKRGQSFLKNQFVASEIVRLAKITADDTVLEIGGGLGILTTRLAERAKSVHVVELEHGLANALRDRFVDCESVTVIEGDALTVELPEVDKVVSNLPYSISSEITFRLLQECEFQYALLMYQKEFAQRLVAQPNSQAYSRLTVNFQYLAQAEHIMEVGASMFYPEPAVDSIVVRVKHRRNGPFARDGAVFNWMVRGIYSYPNKHLRRAMQIWFKNLGADMDLVDTIIQMCDMDGLQTMRPRNLGLDVLIPLADTITYFVERGALSKSEGHRHDP